MSYATKLHGPEGTRVIVDDNRAIVDGERTVATMSSYSTDAEWHILAAAGDAIEACWQLLDAVHPDEPDKEGEMREAIKLAFAACAKAAMPRQPKTEKGTV